MFFSSFISVSESFCVWQGTSHLTDDGWAETQNKRSEVSESSQVFHEHVKHQERDWSTESVREQKLPDSDLMSFCR